MQVQIDAATRQVLAYGEFPADPSAITITDAQAAKLTLPGAKVLGLNGQITVTPPDPNATRPVAPNPTRDAAVATLRAMAGGGANAAIARAILDLAGVA